MLIDPQAFSFLSFSLIRFEYGKRVRSTVRMDTFMLLCDVEIVVKRQIQNALRGYKIRFKNFNLLLSARYSNIIMCV